MTNTLQDIDTELDVVTGGYNFKVLNKLGSGKYGTVYSVVTNQNVYTHENVIWAKKGEYLAVKVEQIQGDHSYDLIEKELEILRELGSPPNPCIPHTVCYRKSFMLNAKVYIFMTLGPGITLIDFIINLRKSDDDTKIYIQKKSLTPLSLTNQLLDYVDNVLQAVESIHKHGIAHRDIKPDNMMIEVNENKNMSITLVDFGFACHISECSPKPGTPLYDAPEIKYPNGQTFDITLTDGFATGCTVYAMLSGTNRFRNIQDYVLFMRNKQVMYTSGLPWFDDFIKGLTSIGAHDRLSYFEDGSNDIFMTKVLKHFRTKRSGNNLICSLAKYAFSTNK